MSNGFDIRNPQNELIMQAYQKDNYIIYDINIDSDICYIFFSSHGLYYPDTEEVFRKEILEKERYEWKWVAKNSSVYERAGRVVFVRDVWKCHYQRGVNSNNDTIDKTLDLLMHLTNGYRVITIGSSAGGYMAVLSGIKLNADYILNFSGQYHLTGRGINNTYCDLTDLLKKYTGKIFYFVPAHYEPDYIEYLSVHLFDCICAFLFKDNKHAATMLTGNLCYIVDKDKDTLYRYYQNYDGKEIGKIEFLLHTVPLSKLIKVMVRETKGFVIRRLGKHWNGV